MRPITDEFMQKRLLTVKNYCLVILKATPKGFEPGVNKIVWEHGRRDFALHEEGLISIVCPVLDESDMRGIYIFNLSVSEVRQIMDGDPGVKAGVFTYELHECRGVPGQYLPW
jgi:hypothetical protein